MTGSHGLMKIVRTAFFLICIHTSCAAYSIETVFSDSMSLNNDRKADQNLAKSAMEKGNATWYTVGSVVFRADGTATSIEADGGTAFHSLPFAANIYRISAEINAASTSCTAIAFGNKIPFGNFFLSTVLSLVLNPDGGYEVIIRGYGNIKSGTKADYPDFKVDGFTKLELEYNSMKNTVTAKINGMKILDDEEMVSKKIGPFFTHASFRFNGPLEPGVPKLKNYSVTLIHEKAPERTRPSNKSDKSPEAPFTGTL